MSMVEDKTAPQDKNQPCDDRTEVKDIMQNEPLGIDNPHEEIDTELDYDFVVAQSFPSSDPPPSVIVGVRCLPGHRIAEAADLAHEE